MNERLLATIVLVILIVFLIASPAIFGNILEGWLEAFNSFSERRPVLAIGGFLGLAAASIILGPFTSAPTVPFAVAAWGQPLSLLLLLCGWMLGGIAAYALGLWIGEPLVARVVGPRKLEDWLHKIRPHLDFTTLLLFRLAMPSETGYIFGLLQYRFAKYLLITLLAEIPFALLIVYGSAALVSTSVEALVFAGVVWVALIGLALRFFLRRVR